MTTEIRLLGVPRVLHDGTAEQAPRGRKVWGLLAYLVLRRTPASRSHLAELLFPGADDPLAALRWTMSILRRVLGEGAVLQGDPLTLRWVEEPFIDALAVRSSPDLDADLGAGLHADLERELLEAMRFPGCPSFEIWLEAERRHARGAAEALLHEGALGRLARGDFDGAADLAGRLVALNPYDENGQALLVRALASGGRGVEAARQSAAARELFRSELGVEPGPALQAAASTTTARAAAPSPSPIPSSKSASGPVAGPASGSASGSASGPAGVTALIDAGEAAIRAGALQTGLDCLRRAAAEAEALTEHTLPARAFTALGAALVHAARGGDEEGVTSLHRALTYQEAAPEVLAKALYELGYVEYLRGRYDRVDHWLAQAEQHSDAADLVASVLSIRGSTLSDRGRYPEALAALTRSVEVAENERRTVYSLSMVGRLHLLRGDLGPAADVLDDALARCGRIGWTTFVPWPESLRGEVDLVRGDVGAAQGRFEHAFALGCQIGDPCWEGLAGRGLGLALAAKGDLDAAVPVLLDARRRSSRLPDAYVWVQAYTLDALTTVGISAGLPQARGWAAELADVAGHSGMAELNARAALHQGRLGDPAGLEAARSLASAIENPVLTALLR